MPLNKETKPNQVYKMTFCRNLLVIEGLCKNILESPGALCPQVLPQCSATQSTPGHSRRFQSIFQAILKCCMILVSILTVVCNHLTFLSPCVTCSPYLQFQKYGWTQPLYCTVKIDSGWCFRAFLFLSKLQLHLMSNWDESRTSISEEACLTLREVKKNKSRQNKKKKEMEGITVNQKEKGKYRGASGIRK